MKKIIIILGVMLFSLCSLAQGSKNVRNHQMPEKIENFFRYADESWKPAIRYERYDNEGGIPTKTVMFQQTLNNKKAITQALDSIRSMFNNLINDEVMECYMRESHQNGLDTILYKLTLDPIERKRHIVRLLKPEKSETIYLESEYSARQFVFQYMPITENRGSASLMYEYKDSALDKPSEPINKKEYWSIVKKVLKGNGVKGRSWYLYNDSTLHNHLPDVTRGSKVARSRIIKQEGYIYEMDTREQYEKIIQDLIQKTWIFLDKHPYATFVIHPTMPGPGTISESIRLRQDDNSYDSFKVEVYRQHEPEHFWLFIREIYNDDFWPKECLQLKSYKNGKKVYYKQK